MRKIVLLFIFVFTCSNVEIFADKSIDSEDLFSCVKKYHHEWARACSACKQEANTYTVFLRNECTQPVDVKCAVQEVEKKWRTFTRLKMMPADTMLAYACNGNGKYLYWVRKAGDKTVPFPADEEINITYGK